VLYLGMKIINMDQLAEYVDNNDYTHVGGDFYEDAGGHVVHEDEIIGLMEKEYSEDLIAQHEDRIVNLYGDI